MIRLVEGLTPGAARAITKLGGRAPCGTCGFSLPKYPGRYPSKCPQCETPIAEAAKCAPGDEPEDEPEDEEDDEEDDE